MAQHEQQRVAEIFGEPGAVGVISVMVCFGDLGALPSVCARGCLGRCVTASEVRAVLEEPEEQGRGAVGEPSAVVVRRRYPFVVEFSRVRRVPRALRGVRGGRPRWRERSRERCHRRGIFQYPQYIGIGLNPQVRKCPRGGDCGLEWGLSARAGPRGLRGVAQQA